MAKSKGRRVRRWIWIAVLAVAAASGFAAFRPKGQPAEDKDKVKTAKAEIADVQVRVTEVGSVEPQVKVDVKSALSGKVVELLVREGDAVKRGQVLARVEPGVNQARDLAQVKNSVHEAEIALNEANATDERNKGLLGQGLLSAQSGLESESGVDHRHRRAGLRPEEPLEPGVLVLSEEANQQIPVLMKVFMFLLDKDGVKLKPDEFVANIPAEFRPRKTLLEIQQEFQDRYNEIMKAHGFDYMDGAKTGAVVCELLVKLYALRRKDLEPKMAASIVSMGFIEGAKTAPVPMNQDRQDTQ